MRITTLASACGLLFSAAAIAGDNHAGSTVGALRGFVFPASSSAKLSARAPQLDGICTESRDCGECFGDAIEDIEACPDKYQTTSLRKCYSPSLSGVVLGCGEPGDEEYDEKWEEFRGSFSDEELQDIAEDIQDGDLESAMDKIGEADLGAASSLSSQGLLMGAVVGAGVLMVVM